ncbi:MAG: class I tRNA ligase family protein, partial [Phycisphaerales bacterium]|nr:class I tRNA ligase family protein [Phycisphaerales bacterium]
RGAVSSVRASMDQFENYPAAQTLNEFVESLSNWYVRRSRDRFWRPLTGDAAQDQDKWDAYHTLYGCLRVISHLIAPFTPFFAETMHQILRIPQDPISIHLCDYPTPEDIRYQNEALSQEMNLVREVVSLGRAARSGGKLKVRQPLAQVEIILARMQDEPALKRHIDLILEELNVKTVEFTTDADHYVSYKVAPNFAVIGKKFRGLAQAIKPALASLSDPAAARNTLLATGRLPLIVSGETIELTPDEVEIRLEAKPGWSAAQGRAGVVVLSTEISDSLREEGLIRELIHHIQGLRREHDLAYQARITLYLEAGGEFTATVRKHFDSMIRGECLADAMEAAIPTGTAATDVEVEGHAAKLAIMAIR